MPIFKNITKRGISVIHQGKKHFIRPGEKITGNFELAYYNGLKEIIKNENIINEINKMNNNEENSKILQVALDELNAIDISVPFSKSKYLKKLNRTKFSIIVPINNKEQYIGFLNSLRNQETNVTFEIISIFNFNNEFNSSAEMLNFGRSLSNSEYLLFCHQDLIVPTNWLQKIYSHFIKFETTGMKIGFLGIAGTSKSNMGVFTESGAIYLSNTATTYNGKEISYAQIMRQNNGAYKEVQTLDECVLACSSNLNILFDEVTFDHYHFYGADICLNCINQGYKNFAIDADCFHLSDGQKNLLNEVNQKAYLTQGTKLFKKWRNRFPYFRTTTASFYGPERKWLALIFTDVNKKYNSNLPIEIGVD
jgi:hypothetical protein